MQGEVFNEFDDRAMRRALLLAARGLETTHPNPRVGCVIARDGRIVGEGWHQWAGEAHAEIAALRSAGEHAAGATAYVTLEPCSHHGRTPPCVDALLAARIARVVYAMEDPNPQVHGQGGSRLRAAGVRVESGLLASAALELNEGFAKRMRSGRPWVRVKLAMSLDGRTALRSGASRWITGAAARQDVHRLRARSSGVVTGIGTVLADDPRLDVRLGIEGQAEARRRAPARIVFDAGLRTPLTARLWQAAGELYIVTTLISAGESERARRREELIGRGARVLEVAGAAAEPLLSAALDALGGLEMNELLIESGPRLAGAFLQADLVDELVLYIAPKLLGPQARGLIEIPDIAELCDARQLTLMDLAAVGEDVRLTLRPRRT